MQNRFGNSTWREAMKSRMAFVPQLYLGPKPQEALLAFQEQIKNGSAESAITALDSKLRQRREVLVADCRARAQTGDMEQIQAFLFEAGFTDADFRRLAGLAHTAKDEKVDRAAALAKVVQEIFEERDAAAITDLRKRVEAARRGKYHPDDDRWRMLHMNYLEGLFPNLYFESTAWQAYPEEDVNTVLAADNALRKAYLTGDAATFSQASQSFFDTIRQVSTKYEPNYPNADTVPLEMSFNRIQPFMNAWIYMLIGMICFVASMLLPEGTSKWAYGLGFVGYAVSLGYQVFGFYCRIAISGRPPVSNMYETVIWVSFMTAIFALLLELVYRRKIVIMAGAIVATLGLVLADQLPVSSGFDSKISPLTPVLRSNYWLIIHVLTIVSSYAAGALAWGLGNIALTLIAFGNPKPAAIKTLSQFSYSAIKIAVLLLAAGTFLGGWWAAESWGRFWGWDPKEVWALIALVCYVIPLHARWIGWVKDFGLAVAAVICFSAIVMSWYGVNFVLGAGLHSYGFGGGGPWWIFLAGLVNLEWVLIACWLHARQLPITAPLEETATDALPSIGGFSTEPA
jgi:ABC-type transport system involved in cytochrome c biogenesis permease subunit